MGDDEQGADDHHRKHRQHDIMNEMKTDRANIHARSALNRDKLPLWIRENQQVRYNI